MRVGAAAAAANDADAVRVVAHQPGIVRLGQGLHLGQRRQIAVHAEHAIGQDQAPAGAGGKFTQQLVEMIEIVVAEKVSLGAGELGARQQARMAQLVGEDHIAHPHQARHDAEIGEVTAAEHYGIIGALQRRQTRFEGLVERMIAGDQTRRAGADAVALGGFGRARLDPRVLRQVEIIVRTKRNQHPPVTLDPHRVKRIGNRQGAPQRARLEVIQFFCGKVVEAFHRDDQASTTSTIALVSTAISSLDATNGGIT